MTMSTRPNSGDALNVIGSICGCSESGEPKPRALGGLRRRTRAVRAAAESLELRVLLSSYSLAALTSLTASSATSAGLIIDSSGDLFGVSPSGGTNNDGDVIEVPHGTSTSTIIATFSGVDGSQPSGQLLIDSNGNLYGATARGGADGFGTVFELVNNGSGTYTLTTLADFTADSGLPGGPLVMDNSGDLFGTAGKDAASNGTVFEVAAGGNSVSTVATFGATDYPNNGLVIDSSGDLFGTTYSGGGSQLGSVFEVPVNSGNTLTTVHSFGEYDGAYPGQLTIDSKGDIFGTTSQEGPGNEGTVFEIPSGSFLQTLADFNGQVGPNPTGGVVVDSNGNLFGTDTADGDFGDGGLYEIAANSGTITSVASFTASTGFGANPGIVEDANQDLFGTTSQGGANSLGSIFEATPQTTTGPSAVIMAPPVVSAAATETITVTYTAPNGVNTSLTTGAGVFGTGNVTVTGKNDQALTVSSFVINNQLTFVNGGFTVVVATYTVNAPGSTWTAADNANSPYSITVSGIEDTNGIAMQPVKGSFIVSIGTAPAVSISAPPVTTPGNHDTPITLTFTDPSGISPAQASQIVLIQNAQIKAFNGANLIADATTITPQSGSGTDTLTVQYEIQAPAIANEAPNGDWFTGDNGTYSVSLDAGVVTDLAGLANAAVSTTFQVDIPSTPPVGTFTPPPEVTSATKPQQVVITYTGANSVDSSSINPGNLSITSPAGLNVPVTSVSTNTTSGESPSIIATYTIDPPAGGWVNGGYTVNLNTGSAGVSDSLGETNTTGATTAFLANLPVPVLAGTTSSLFNLRFSAQASAVTSSGAILVVGNEENAAGTGTQGVLERLTASGPDTSFGTDGQIVFPGVQLFSVAVEPTASSTASPAASSYDIIFGGTSSGSLLVGEYTAAGTPAAFGTNGLEVVTSAATFPATAPTDATAYSVVVNPANGDIVAGGTGDSQFLVDELLPNGGQEPAFNHGAPLEFTDGSLDALSTVEVDANGNIVGAGAGATNVVVARVTPAGALDPSFGTNGLVDASALFASGQPELGTLSQSGQLDRTEGLAIDASGKILVANSVQTTVGGTTRLDFGIVRLNPDGAPDTSWGASGLASADFGNTADADVLLLEPNSKQPDGDEVLAVGTSTDANDYVQTAVAEFTGSGTLDSTFGTNGQDTFDPSPLSTTQAVMTNSQVVRPDAEGPGGQYFGYGSLSNGHLVAGSNVPGQSTVRTLVVAAPLTQGTLGLSLATTLPASVIEGTRANQKIRVTVSNLSSGVVSLASLQFYVNTFKSVTEATPLSVQAAKRLSLKPGARQTITLNLPAYPIVPAAGSYYVIASATASDNTVTQVSSASATTIGPAVFAGSISSFEPLVSSVVLNKSVTIALALVNTGNEPLSGTAFLTISGTLEGQTAPITTVALRGVKQKSGSKVYRVKFRIPAGLTPGTYTLSVSLSGLRLPSAITATASSTLTVT